MFPTVLSPILYIPFCRLYSFIDDLKLPDFQTNFLLSIITCLIFRLIVYYWLILIWYSDKLSLLVFVLEPEDTTADVDSDSSSDLSVVAQDADTLVNNLINELGSAAQDADTIGINLAGQLGKQILFMFNLCLLKSYKI